MLEVLNSTGQASVRNALQADVKKAEKDVRPKEQHTSSVPETNRQDPSAKAQKVDPIEKLESSLNDLAGSLLGDQARLSVTHDDSTGRFIYQSVDRSSGEVLRQWPEEEILSQIAYFIENDAAAREAAGMALDESA